VDASSDHAGLAKTPGSARHKPIVADGLVPKSQARFRHRTSRTPLKFGNVDCTTNTTVSATAPGVTSGCESGCPEG